MRIIDVAQQLGISADWLRRLERKGRIPPAKRDINGHRRYTEEDVKRLRAVIFHDRQQVDRENTL